MNKLDSFYESLGRVTDKLSRKAQHMIFVFFTIAFISQIAGLMMMPVT